MSELVYVSLYDYLGKAAGKTLGREVLKEAQKRGIKRKVKHISQGGYEGNVMIYPKQFLDIYFSEKEQNA